MGIAWRGAPRKGSRTAWDRDGGLCGYARLWRGQGQGGCRLHLNMHRVLVDGSGGSERPGSSRTCLAPLQLPEAASTEACRAASWACADALSIKSSKPSGEPASLGRTTGIRTGAFGETSVVSVSRASVSRHKAETVARVHRCNPPLVHRRRNSGRASCVSPALAAAVQAGATRGDSEFGVELRAPSTGVRPVLAVAEE